MKKNLYVILVIFCVFVSCNDDSDIHNAEKTSNLEQKITALNAKYLNSFNNEDCQTKKIATERLYVLSEEMLRLPQNSYNWGKFWGVAKADINGCFEGALVGVALGGGAASACIGGIVGGVVYSADAYYNWKEDTTLSKADQPFSVNDTKPIYNYTHPVFNDNIICSNIGSIHNKIIKDILAQDNFDISNENEIINHTIRYCKDSLNVEFENENEFAATILDILHDNSETSNSSELRPILSLYLECAPNLTGSNLRDYTEEFMRIVNEEAVANNNLEEATIINSAISIGYYSYNLWNINLPNPYTAPIISCYDLVENEWYFISRSYFSQHPNYMSDNYVIGVPVVNDNIIETIYFYDNIPECQTMYVDSLLTNENYIKSNSLTFTDIFSSFSFSTGKYDLFHNQAEGISTLEKR